MSIINAKNYRKVTNSLWEKHVARKYNKKIKRLINANAALKTNELNLKFVKKYWRKYGFKVNTDWYMAFSSFNKRLDVRYIPESIFYSCIERRLNNLSLFKAYTDKNSNSDIIPIAKFPTTILKNKNNMYYDAEDNKLTLNQLKNIIDNIDEEIVIKPSLDSGGGKNVTIGHASDGKILIKGSLFEVYNIEKVYKSDFIIQKKLQQHDVLKRIYPHSVNTLRVVSLRVDNEIKIISVVARFGNNGSKVDNPHATGGVSCGVNDNGELNKFAIDKHINKHYKHPYSQVEFEGIKIPFYHSITSSIKGYHDHLSYFDMVSWDVSIDEKGDPVLIEYNLKGQEINFHQFNNGPLFKEHTDKVLDKISKISHDKID